LPGWAPRSPGLFDACRKCGHCWLDGGVGEVGVTDDDRWGIGAEALQGDPPRACGVEHSLLAETVREEQHSVKTGGGAVDGNFGQLGGDRG
jgi:hypothetical protein